MRFTKSLAAGLLAAVFLSSGAFAGSDLNEIGALLVYPVVIAESAPGRVGLPDLETFVTITNAGAEDVVAHVSFISGQWWDPTYCAECDYRGLCRAGCTSHAYCKTGSRGNNPDCLHRLMQTGVLSP